MRVGTGSIASTDVARDARRIAEAFREQADARREQQQTDDATAGTAGADRTRVPLTASHTSPVRDNADEVLVEFTDGSILRVTPSPGRLRVETQVPDDVDLASFQGQLAARFGLPVSWQRG